MYYGGEGHKNKGRDWWICHLYVNQDTIIKSDSSGEQNWSLVAIGAHDC